MQSWAIPFRALVFAGYFALAQIAVGATPTLDEPFDPSAFTPAEIEILQRALTFTGHYSGLWDGEWGPLSASAVRSYSQANFGGEEVINYGLIPLILDGMARVETQS